MKISRHPYWETEPRSFIVHSIFSSETSAASGLGRPLESGGQQFSETTSQTSLSGGPDGGWGIKVRRGEEPWRPRNDGRWDVEAAIRRSLAWKCANDRRMTAGNLNETTMPQLLISLSNASYPSRFNVFTKHMFYLKRKTNDKPTENDHNKSKTEVVHIALSFPVSAPRTNWKQSQNQWAPNERSFSYIIDCPQLNSPFLIQA